MEGFIDSQRQMVARYIDRYGLDRDDAIILAADPLVGRFFERAAEASSNPQGTANWVIHELLRELKEVELGDLKFSGEELGALVKLIDEGTITGPIAKQVFNEMMIYGGSPYAIVEEQGLQQVSDEAALAPIVAETLDAYPDKVAQYRDGKTGLLGFFVGQIMRKTDGKANPQLVQDLLRTALDES